MSQKSLTAIALAFSLATSPNLAEAANQEIRLGKPLTSERITQMQADYNKKSLCDKYPFLPWAGAALVSYVIFSKHFDEE